MCTWLTVNKLTVNALKSNCHLSSRPKSSNFPFSVNIRVTDSNSNTSQPLEIKNYIKYIGVLIDSNPSWKYHVDYIRQKPVNQSVLLPSSDILFPVMHFSPYTAV